MRPFIGTARYYNRTGLPNKTHEEFIWAGDLSVAFAIMEVKYDDADKIDVDYFLTPYNVNREKLIERLTSGGKISHHKAERFLDKNTDESYY